MSDKKSFRKSCVVPECSNTSVSAPDKLFICLPANQKVRNAWQRAMRRTDFVSDKGSRYCCEDHFVVEKDIENYMYLKTMKSGRIQVKPGVIPHIFDCQRNRTASPSTKPREIFKKRKKLNIMQTHSSEISHNVSSVDEDTERETTAATQTTNRNIQVNFHPHVRSQAIQCSSDIISYQPPTKRKKEMVVKIHHEKPLLSDPSASFSSDSFAPTSDSTCRVGAESRGLWPSMHGEAKQLAWPIYYCD